MKLPTLAVPLVTAGIDAALEDLKQQRSSPTAADCGSGGTSCSGGSHGCGGSGGGGVLGSAAGCCEVLRALAETVLDLAAAAAHSPAWLAAAGGAAFAQGRAALRAAVEQLVPAVTACLARAAACEPAGARPRHGAMRAPPKQAPLRPASPLSVRI